MSDNEDYTNHKLIYLDDCPKLPVGAPVGHPHLIDPRCVSEDFPQEDITVADIVVTILFKYRPEALHAFLDLSRPHVHFISGLWNSSVHNFCIKRDGRTVTVCLVQAIELFIELFIEKYCRWVYLNNRRVEPGWKVQYIYLIKSEATGEWSPIGCDSYHETKTTRKDELAQLAPTLALNFFGREPWDQTSGVEIEWVCGFSYNRGI